jgi:hypothetical protein
MVNRSYCPFLVIRLSEIVVIIGLAKPQGLSQPDACMQTNQTAWAEMVKKDARGLNDFNLGKVHEVGTNFIVTEKGTLSRKYYYIPKYLVKGYDGHNLWFNVTETQADTEFKRDKAPTTEDYYKYKTPTMSSDVENWVPRV